MLNRESRAVLRVLNQFSRENRPFSEIELYNKIRIYDRAKMVKLCLNLQKTGYLDTLIIDDAKTIHRLELSYLGMTYRQAARRQVMKYIADKWIDFFALVVSIAALVIALLSLLSR